MESQALARTSSAKEKQIQTIEYWLQRRLWSPSQLRKAVMKRWNLDPPQAQRLIDMAKKHLQLAIVRQKDALRAEAFQFYRSVILNPEVSWTERIRAQERIDKLLGLDAPTEIDISLTAQTARLDEIPIEVRKRILEELRRVRDENRLLEPINGESSLRQ